jgi:hypothetical protein
MPVLGNKPFRIGFKFIFLVFFILHPAYALRPMVHYHDLVAGEGDMGSGDGPFYSACFNGPQGLALSADGLKLFVADAGNNSIRIVHLDQDNRVETLSGDGKQGYLDGPLSTAKFNNPTALLMLPENRLVVNESNNACFRLIDLNQGVVSTLAGNLSLDYKDGKAREAAIRGVWNMAYMPQEKAIYFTQPLDGVIRKLDMKTNEITTVLKGDPQLPHPAAMCLFQNKLCVADKELPTVYQVEFKANTTYAERTAELGKGQTIVALTAWKDKLYALQAGKIPIARLSTPEAPLNLMSVWGTSFNIEDTDPRPNPFLNLNKDDAAGFIPDPNQERRFFIASIATQSVVSFKDYYFEKYRDLHDLSTHGLNDFDYPTAKPPHTFRILIVGNSLSFSTGTTDHNRWGWGFNRMETMPKRLELLLNTEAAMDDCPENFEVMDIGYGEDQNPAFLWPYYEVPPLVKTFDIDLVLYICASVTTDSFKVYFQRPLNSEGIPVAKTDPEYLTKPWKEKIPKGVPEDFYKKCLARQWVTPASESQLSFGFFDGLIQDEGVRKDLQEMEGKPVSMFAQKIRELHTSKGAPVGCAMMFMLSRDHGSGTLDLHRDFWREVAAQSGLPFIDLSKYITAFEQTYFPLDEYGEHFHIVASGHPFYAYVVAHELLDENLIPPLKSVKPADNQQK